MQKDTSGGTGQLPSLRISGLLQRAEEGAATIRDLCPHDPVHVFWMHFVGAPGGCEVEIKRNGSRFPFLDLMKGTGIQERVRSGGLELYVDSTI